MVDRWLKLTDDRVREIRKVASRCLRQVGCVGPKVPIDSIAKRIGAKVLFAPHEGDQLAGMLIFPEGQPVIAVNSNHHSNRQRFTIAHELGHLLLGHTGGAHVDRTFVINRDGRSASGTDRFEVEANQFAAELLMPIRFLLRDMRALDFEDDQVIDMLASKYGVSRAAMSYRVAKIFM